MISVKARTYAPTQNKVINNLRKNFVVNLGKEKINVDEYVNFVDNGIINELIKHPKSGVACSFARAQVADFRYKSTISRYFRDIDEAVLNNLPQKRIDGLVKRLERFIVRKDPFANPKQ